jgi:hypothetical protein
VTFSKGHLQLIEQQIGHLDQEIAVCSVSIGMWSSGCSQVPYICFGV